MIVLLFNLKLKFVMKYNLKFVLILLLSFTSAHSQQWQGHWSSSFGEIKVMEKVISSQNAGLVFGNYAKLGTLIGVSFGGKLHGYFYDQKSKKGGEFTFTQRQTGHSFTGKWSYKGKVKKLDWNGNKINNTLANDFVNVDRFRSVEGQWDSNFGPLNFIQDGVFIEASYSDKGRIHAVYNQANNMIYGLFTNKEKFGLLYFNFNAEKNAFKGLWSWETKNWSDQVWSGELKRNK